MSKAICGCAVGALVSVVLLAQSVAWAEAAATATQDGAPGVSVDYGDWYPRTSVTEKGTLVVHAPQIESWTDFQTLTAWLAFSATRKDAAQTFYGSVRFAAQTDTDLQQRTVLLHDLDVQELTIKGLTQESEEYQLAEAALTRLSRTVPLDLILEYLPQDLPLETTEGLQTDPPMIFVSTQPAVLLSADSEPVYLPVEGQELKFVLNANWDVLREGDDGAHYLCYQNAWLTAESIEGPWRWAEQVPPELAELPAGSNWDDARACMPQNLKQSASGEVPQVFYSNVPAELLLLDGEPQWVAIAEGGLSYAANTKQEIFRVDDRVYVLFSGRWFSADDLEASWHHTVTLPEAFQQIPETAHAKSYIRNSVPGTKEAWEAALMASLPRKAEIVRGTEDALALDVSYAGQPTFQPIEGIAVEMAVNTSYQVLKYENAYYVCHNAVWLVGENPQGPWRYADKVPAAFAAIPPSSPAYNTTFVQVEKSSPQSIEYSYTSGYENAYVYNNTVVYGTGYAYSAAATWVIYEAMHDDYWHRYPFYPYYPWPVTYGYGAWYDPDTGRYGETLVGYGPYGAAAGAAVYNPETGVYARGQAMWDSDEYAGRGYAYNPNTNTSIARNRYIDAEDNEGWSNRVARRGDEWRYTESEWEDGRMRTEFESSRGTEGEVYRERDGDTLQSSGTISYGDREVQFESERERDGDAITGEGTISGENRSADFDSTFEDGQRSVTWEGSEGGSGEINRELDDGELSSSGTFSRNGKTIETDSSRTAEGVRREFETDSGGKAASFRSGDERGFVAETGSGDLYAGRDGEVYQRSDDGWSKVENPRAGDATSTATETRGSRDGSRIESTTIKGASRATDQRARTGALRADTGRASQLERDFQRRQRGYERFSRSRTSRQFGGGGGVRRARR